MKNFKLESIESQGKAEFIESLKSETIGVLLSIIYDCTLGEYRIYLLPALPDGKELADKVLDIVEEHLEKNIKGSKKQ